MKFEYQDRIDSYVRGEMTAEERVAFEEEVRSDKELQEQLEYTKQVKALVSSRQEKLKLLKQWEEEERDTSAQLSLTDSANGPLPDAESPESPSKSSSRKLVYWISGAAAVFALAVFVINPMTFDGSTVPTEGESRGDAPVFSIDESISNDSIDNDSILIFDDEE